MQETLSFEEIVYVIIHNGDHAEFEMESANLAPEDRPDWPLPSFDARDWAIAFMKVVANKPETITTELMIAWFANSLMRGFDEACTRKETNVREFIGWLSGDIPELRSVEVPVLADSWDRFRNRSDDSAGAQS